MRKRAITLCALLAFTTGCASNSGSSVRAESCPTPAGLSAEYLIGPGDTLNIVVWENSELSVNVPVRPDGKVSTPLVDDMQAAGKTPSELSLDMELVLSEYLRSPEVSVIVTGQGAANQIQVVGEVTRPQSLSYRAGLRMLDLIVSVGGLTDFAAGNRANLVRQTSAGQVECQIKLKDLLGGDMSQNIFIYPGDVLVVPETRF